LLDFERLLEPSSLKNFLENDFSRNWKLFQGKPGRFSHVICEDLVLSCIASRDIPYHRITMLHSGEPLSPELYASPGHAVGQLRPDTKRIKHHLTQGSVLLITHAEQLYKPLWDIAESLGEHFEDTVTVNIYLGGPQSKGFKLHIDHHDVLVFQVQGNKDWEIREPSLKHPLVLPEHITEPPVKSLWEGTLRDGDILYLPRGFWHRAQAQDAPSLHLTFGIQPCTGLHFLGWLRKKLLSNELFRAEVPRHNPDKMRQYLLSLENTLQELHHTDQVNLFLQEHSSRIKSERTDLKNNLYPQKKSGD
jgi:ribosomal protein L16 Arg81 hydroxylase